MVQEEHGMGAVEHDGAGVGQQGGEPTGTTQQPAGDAEQASEQPAASAQGDGAGEGVGDPPAAAPDGAQDAPAAASAHPDDAADGLTPEGRNALRRGDVKSRRQFAAGTNGNGQP